MDPIIKKLNFKDHQQVAVLQSPATFGQVLSAWRDLVSIDMAIKPDTRYDFVLAFAEMAVDIERYAAQLQGHLVTDPVLWIAYPKKSSRRYRSDISRDNGWQVLGDMGLEGVRQVAIDEDWSALRFRPAAQIKTMKRDPSRAMSRLGKRKIKGD